MGASLKSFQTTLVKNITVDHTKCIKCQTSPDLTAVQCLHSNLGDVPHTGLAENSMKILFVFKSTSKTKILRKKPIYNINLLKKRSKWGWLKNSRKKRSITGEGEVKVQT